MSEHFTWIPPEGDELDLIVERNVEGHFAPSATFTIDSSPLTDGAFVRQVRHEPKRLTLPIIIKGTDRVDVRQKVTSLLRSMNPKRGPGALRRRLDEYESYKYLPRVYVEDGLQLSEIDSSTSGKCWQRIGLLLLAEDPYWWDESVEQFTFEYEATTSTFFPFFPLSLLASSVFGLSTVSNDGDVEAFPLIYIEGPGSSIYVRNITTGAFLHLDMNLLAGETITVDTRPGYKTITKQDGTNLFSYQGTGSSLFSLDRGSNQIQIEISSADPDTSVSFAFQQRWLSP